VKHDGYRLLARKDGARARLWTRRGADFTDRMPWIAEGVRGLPVEQFLIDGEAVVFRADGRSDFEALRTKEGGARAAYVAFDLLEVNGKDIRRVALEDRRAELERIVASAEAILFNEAFAAEGALVFAKACAMGLEGIVSKRAGSRYPSGSTRTWRKCKNPAFIRT
jgi:bifunctional non-homologous end joining protein LigD